ncbi:hypothetical protein ACFL0V_02755 [Nanoarchaeota archaeon]
MILKRVSLRNIRSYEREEVVFPDGSMVLAGDIGSGKSSVLLAIEFALFGVRRDMTGDALLRKGCEKGEVELEFGIEGKQVRIKRGLKRARMGVAQDVGFIEVNGTLEHLTTMEMKARVLDMLGYPKELLTKSKSLIYRYTVYTPQEEMKQILFDNPESRIDTLRKVFGIDKYKQIIENTGMFAKSLRDKRKILGAQIQDLDVKQRQLTSRKEEVAQSDYMKENAKKELLVVRGQREERQKDLDKVQDEIKEMQELQKRNEILESRLVEIVRQRAKNLDEITGYSGQLDLLKQKEVKVEVREYPSDEEVERIIRGKEYRLQKMSMKKTELVERQNGITRRMNEIKERVEKKTDVDVKEEYERLVEELRNKDMIRDVLEEMDKEMIGLGEKLAELKVRREGSREVVDGMSGLDVCPTCRQEVRVEHKEKITKTEERKTLELGEQMQELELKKKNLIERISGHKDKMEAFLEKEKRLFGLKVEAANQKKLAEEIEELRKRKVMLEKDKLEVLDALEDLDDAVIEQLQKEIDEKRKLQREIADYKMKVKEAVHHGEMVKQKELMIKNLGMANDELKERVKDVNREKLETGEKLLSFKEIEKEFGDKKKIIEDERLKEIEIEKRIEGMMGQQEGLKKMIAMLQEEVDVKKKHARDIERIGRVHDWLDGMFVKLMTRMERYIMIRVHQQFSELFSHWFGLLLEGEINVRLDDSFSPVVEQNGYEMQVENLSGGEKTSIALAYRLALNKVVNDIVQEVKTKDLIILDEPTDGFSTEQLDKVRDVLDELDMKQIIIVSHEAKIESFVENVVRVGKVEHVSRVEG